MFVGVPMNIGFGSFSFSSSLPGSVWAPSGANAKTSNSELMNMRLVMNGPQEIRPAFRGCVSVGKAVVAAAPAYVRDFTQAAHALDRADNRRARACPGVSNRASFR